MFENYFDFVGLDSVAGPFPVLQAARSFLFLFRPRQRDKISALYFVFVLPASVHTPFKDADKDPVFKAEDMSFQINV